jgi:hypothetical protein
MPLNYNERCAIISLRAQHSLGMHINRENQREEREREARAQRKSPERAALRGHNTQR